MSSSNFSPLYTSTKQWGNFDLIGTSGTFYLPISYIKFFQIVANDIGAGAHSLGISPISLDKIQVYASETTTFRYISIGY